MEPEDLEEAKKRDARLLSVCFNDDITERLLKEGICTVGHQGKTLLLQDTMTGLPYICEQGQMMLDRGRMLSPHYDVIDACFYRQLLREGDYPGKGKMLLTSLFTRSALDRYGLASVHVLDQKIKDYYVNSKTELLQTVQEIEQKLGSGPYFKRLWFRGQRTEYTINRDPQVCQMLGLGFSGQQSPSLLPTIGRYVRDGGKVDFSFVFAGPNHAWKKPFIMWFIRNNSHWFSHYPEFMERLEAALRSEDDEIFAGLLDEIRLDPRVPTEVDDLRQWFFAHYKSTTWVLVLQQYGYLTSMLDITWDIETALFFTHARMIDRHFELVQPSSGRVIYVFAESEGSSSFVDAREFNWGDEDWVRGIPPRIQNQRCGALFGSQRTSKNIYGHLVIARIYLTDPGITTERTVEEVFPPASEDLLYRTLLDSVPRPEGLY